MTPRSVLRFEGLAVLVAALGVYLGLNGPLSLLAVLALAPDISMAGYLAGPRIGSRLYNVAHTYTLPLALGGAGVILEIHMAMLVALIWGAHIGVDRFVGYGLKYSSGFKDTHLSPPCLPPVAPTPITSEAD